MKNELLNNHQRIYVAACGQQFTSGWLGREHELSCISCSQHINPKPGKPCIKWDNSTYSPDVEHVIYGNHSLSGNDWLDLALAALDQWDDSRASEIIKQLEKLKGPE